MEADVLIIGAGVIGLACGAELARAGRTVLVIERLGGPGRETSSHNSEVIHAGLYYPANSLKAGTCVRGRELLYDRCRELRIPHRKTGKYIVASQESQLATLQDIQDRGQRNGAGALAIVEGAELRRREPRVRGFAALWSPESGIVDSHQLMASYQSELEAHGATVVFRTEVVELEMRPGGWRVVTQSDAGERYDIDVGWVVNAAGLAADGIAARAGVDLDAAGLRQHACKGDYFAVAPSMGALTTHLVYPVPEPGGLGIHITLDLGGRYRLGPDVEWAEAPNRHVAPEKAARFAEAVQSYLPEIRAEHLTPDFCGIRPKLAGPGESVRDFHIQEAAALGAPQLINCLGIESPGLTAAGAIAQTVAVLVD